MESSRFFFQVSLPKLIFSLDFQKGVTLEMCHFPDDHFDYVEDLSSGTFPFVDNIKCLINQYIKR